MFSLIWSVIKEGRKVVPPMMHSAWALSRIVAYPMIGKSWRLPDTANPVLATQQSHGVSVTVLEQHGRTLHSRRC